MATRPYEGQEPPKGETLPMGWADGRTVPMLPEPPAYGTVLPAPAAPGARGRSIVIGVVGGLIAGGLALALAIIFLRDAEPTTQETVKSAAATPSTTDTKAPAQHAAAHGDAAPKPASRCPAGMTYVEGGKFFMGTDADDAVLQSARPAHPAMVASFCIDIDEITVDEYRACSIKGECKRAFRDSTWPQGSSDTEDWRAAMAAHSELCNERFDDRGKHPVNCVDWAQARHFCQHRAADLPTEAQWEFAARGSDGRVYPWGDALPTPEHMNGSGREYVAWRESKGLPPHGVLYEADDGFIGTAPVGRFGKGHSQRGLHDIAGNVFEWTLDEFKPYAADADTPATTGPKKRVIRGGAFNSFQPQFADPALRFPQAEDAHNHGIGFRCVAEPKPPE
jgi:formylglycine-generating enzyme required for sulfatase activity